MVPRLAVVVSAVLTMVRAGVSTSTELRQAAVPLPGGHELPAAVETAESTSDLSPGSGLRTVTE